MNQIDLKHRVAVVTGGAQGIGLAIAERLLRSGAIVLLWDIDSAKIDLACRTLDGHGAATGEVVDLTDDGAVATATAAAVAERAGRLGLAPHADFAEIVRQYIADCEAAPNAAQTLKGLAR